MTTIERASMATTTKTPRTKAGPAKRVRRPAPPPTVDLYTGDGPTLLREVRRAHDIRHQPDVDQLVAAFMDEAGLVPGALCPCDEVRALFAPFVKLVGTAVIRDAARTTEASAPLPGHPVTDEEVEEYEEAHQAEPDDEADEADEDTGKGEKAAGKPTATSAKTDPVEARRKALAVTFFTGADWISWGEATVEDHEQRIAYLGRKVAGIQDTIQKHTEAIDLIEAEQGATCLNDLETAFVP